MTQLKWYNLIIPHSYFHLQGSCFRLDWQLLRTNRCDCWRRNRSHSIVALQSGGERQHGSSGFMCQWYHSGCLGCFEAIHIVSSCLLWRECLFFIKHFVPQNFVDGLRDSDLQLLYVAQKPDHLGRLHDQDHKVRSNVSDPQVDMVLVLPKQSKQTGSLPDYPVFALSAGHFDRCICLGHRQETKVRFQEQRQS